MTIREAFELLLAYWRLYPKKAGSEPLVNLLEAEYSYFSNAERSGFAYFGNSESLSGIGSDARQNPVLRPHPKYWNRNLPWFVWLRQDQYDRLKALLTSAFAALPQSNTKDITRCTRIYV